MTPSPRAARSLDEALSQAIEDLQAGLTPLQVLDRYPEYEVELAELIETAYRLRTTRWPVLSMAARVAGRERMHAALAQERMRRRFVVAPLWRQFGAGLALVLLAGTTYLASPVSPLRSMNRPRLTATIPALAPATWTVTVAPTLRPTATIAATITPVPSPTARMQRTAEPTEALDVENARSGTPLAAPASATVQPSATMTRTKVPTATSTRTSTPTVQLTTTPQAPSGSEPTTPTRPPDTPSQPVVSATPPPPSATQAKPAPTRTVRPTELPDPTDTVRPPATPRDPTSTPDVPPVTVEEPRPTRTPRPSHTPKPEETPPSAGEADQTVSSGQVMQVLRGSDVPQGQIQRALVQERHKAEPPRNRNGRR